MSQPTNEVVVTKSEMQNVLLRQRRKVTRSVPDVARDLATLTAPHSEVDGETTHLKNRSIDDESHTADRR